MTLLNGNQLTFFTMTIGPLLALVLFGICYFRCRERVTPDLPFVMVSNCTALVPIVCLILNQLHASFMTSFAADKARATAEAAPLGPQAGHAALLQGNEITVFLALVYAAITIAVSLYRNVRVSAP